MGGAGAGGGGRAARLLRRLLLLVMTLAAVEYLCGTIFEASPLRTYLYTPPTLIPDTETEVSSSWHRRLYKEVIDRENVTLETLPQTTPIKNDSVNIDTHTEVTKEDVQESTTSLLISKLVNITFKSITSTEATTTFIPALPDCKEPSNLGPVKVNKKEIELASIANKFPEVEMGGRYKPPNCTTKNKVAIILPFRDREQHLAIFLNHMHPFLMKQKVVEYGIFVIEQKGNSTFNRAKLFNVGFMESNLLHEGDWQCFIFHDVDLLPMDERNIYVCPSHPGEVRHFSALVDTFRFKLPYESLFGGVSALTYDQFIQVNGFSNKYWGWGGEDDDMSSRVRTFNKIVRYNNSIPKYTMLHHSKQNPNPDRFKLLKRTNKKFKKDGLSTLTYKLERVVEYPLFTLVSVNIDEDS